MTRPPRRQRFAFARHTSTPTPTAADFAANVYNVCLVGVCDASVTVPVLALMASQAESLARYRLLRDWPAADVNALRCASISPGHPPSPDLLSAMLEMETPEEALARQYAYTEATS